MNKVAKLKTEKAPTAVLLNDSVRSWLPWGGSFCHENVFLKNSPWEADLIRVMKSGFWHEYEIKLSVADYRNDFQKKVNGYVAGSPRKHAIYSSPDPFSWSGIRSSCRGVIPKPATFSFVIPKGLLDGIEVPKHCGVIEVEVRGGGYAPRVAVRRKAPRLKKPTRLEAFHLFNLCQKRSG